MRMGATGARSNVNSFSLPAPRALSRQSRCEKCAQKEKRGEREGDAYVCVRGSRKKLQKVILVGEKKPSEDPLKVGMGGGGREGRRRGATCAAREAL